MYIVSKSGKERHTLFHTHAFIVSMYGMEGDEKASTDIVPLQAPFHTICVIHVLSYIVEAERRCKGLPKWK